eukprot:CAMPEP_0184451790 /NCGR_PEP_ID=MMETSP0740-20130409/6672_1 /TAXON_ID=385413 /ORGANISM="Thalassiosira miniscula, Strain CCMP1093" /LENGTH=47 /DNA_ID= /DNA_START= /DNA_END= /DNA_ORIENTATION=
MAECISCIASTHSSEWLDTAKSNNIGELRTKLAMSSVRNDVYADGED